MGTKSASELVQEARQRVQNLSVDEVAAELGRGNVTLIDLREPAELESGRIPGSVNAPRGMLEFYADPTTPYYRPEFDRNQRIILHCASGGRSALAADTLRQMGYTDVGHMDGGFRAWEAAGKPVEKP